MSNEFVGNDVIYKKTVPYSFEPPKFPHTSRKVPSKILTVCNTFTHSCTISAHAICKIRYNSLFLNMSITYVTTTKDEHNSCISILYFTH